MKGPSRKERLAMEEEESDGLDEEERAALQMLNPEQRKMFVELE